MKTVTVELKLYLGAGGVDCFRYSALTQKTVYPAPVLHHFPTTRLWTGFVLSCPVTKQTFLNPKNFHYAERIFCLIFFFF